MTLQTWVMTAAPASAEVATSVYCFVFNLFIAVRAAASGLVVDALGVPSVLWPGAVLVLLVLLTVRPGAGHGDAARIRRRRVVTIAAIVHTSVVGRPIGGPGEV